MDLTTRLRAELWTPRSKGSEIWDHPLGLTVMPHPTNGGQNWYAPGASGVLEMGCEDDVQSAKLAAQKCFVAARKAHAVQVAQQRSEQTGFEHVAVEDFGCFYVGRRYMPGREGYQHDAGLFGMGVLVQESIPTMRP